MECNFQGLGFIDGMRKYCSKDRRMVEIGILIFLVLVFNSPK